MTDRPILFSAPMIRSLLAGTKTQTRRAIKFTDVGNVSKFRPIGTEKATGRRVYEIYDDMGRHTTRPAGRGFADYHYMPPYASGDRLWVREAFSYSWAVKDDPERRHLLPVWHWADGNPEDGDWSKPKPSIHMPRWVSRLTLIVTDVRVQRLQEISEEDAIAEGCRMIEDGPGAGFWIVDGAPMEVCAEGVVECYGRLWDSINGPGAWEANPWVAAYTFRVIKANIDSPEARSG
jgi:hypothetical protein